MRRRPALLLLLCLRLAVAQTAPQPVSTPAQDSQLQLSPQAAYDQAARPLDITRRAVENWSDVEQAALKVATDQAKTACLARTPYQFTGEDLLAYARLCAFAQQWQPVQQAATGYLIAWSAADPAEKLTNFPNLSMAFDYEVQASLHLNNYNNAFGTAQTMLRSVPYDDLASDATNATVRYVQLIQTAQALILLNQRQPIILGLLRAHTPPGSAAQPSARPPLTIHELYADAIALPAMQQFANDPKAAAASFAELEAALPATLSPDDAIFTAESRRQYLLLGSPLPAIAPSAWLLDPSSFAVPRDLNPKFAAASVYLLFPDWCAQCVRKGPDFTAAAARLRQNDVPFYALLAQADPQPPIPKQAPSPHAKPTPQGTSKSPRPPASPGAKEGIPHVEIQMTGGPIPAEVLLGTPTLIVPVETVKTFAATDFPLIIVTDYRGIVRYIQSAPDNALVRNGLIDQLADRVIEQWPASVPQ
jgi:hypothetical protein